MIRSAAADGEAATHSPADTLIKAGAVVSGAGFLAVIGVMAAGGEALAEALLVAAMTLVPLGFCLAAAGFLTHVRARVRRSRPGTP